MIKCLFGLSYDLEKVGTYDEEKLEEISRMLALIDSRMFNNGFLSPSNTKIYLDQVACLATFIPKFGFFIYPYKCLLYSAMIILELFNLVMQ